MCCPCSAANAGLQDKADFINDDASSMIIMHTISDSSY